MNRHRRVIGILFTGHLDDGTAGMSAISRCRGTCVVRDPKDAAYPDMPRNALNQVKDRSQPATGAEVRRKLGKSKPIPKDISIEAKFTERVLSDLRSVEALEEPLPFNCPGCGGVLWRVRPGQALHYRVESSILRLR